MIRTAMSEIKKLRGMDEFKQLADKLDQIARNRMSLWTTKICLPNYLFAVAPGCGTTTYIHQFAKLLDELHLMRFEGENRCFEWIIDSKAFETNAAFDRLLEKVKAMAGFRSAFYGVVGIDINDWCEECTSPKLNRLLDFCEDMQGQILFVFVVELHEEKQLASVAERLSLEMPLETVRFPQPSTEEFVLALSDFLQERGFALAQGVESVLTEIMPQLVSLHGFDGFQTLDNLADEIVYHFCSKGKVEKPLLSGEDFDFINAPGGYLERLGSNRPNKHRRIGFDSRRNPE